MKLNDILTPPVTCRMDRSLAETAAVMESRNVGSVIVVDETGSIVGIATDRDIAIRGVAKRHGPDTPISEVMTRDVISLAEDADLFDAAARMASADCRRLAVVGADGALKGVVSLDDLMVQFTRQSDNLAHVIEAETAAR